MHISFAPAARSRSTAAATQSAKISQVISIQTYSVMAFAATKIGWDCGLIRVQPLQRNAGWVSAGLCTTLTLCPSAIKIHDKECDDRENCNCQKDYLQPINSTRTHREHPSSCIASLRQVFAASRGKSGFGRIRRPRTASRVRSRRASQAQRGPSQRSHQFAEGVGSAGGVGSCSPRTWPALARQACMPKTQRRVHVISHRARHGGHLVLSGHQHALLQILTPNQHAILVRSPRKFVIPRTTLGACSRVEREKRGRQPELPAEERVPWSGGRRRTARGRRKPSKASASHYGAAKPQSANAPAR